MILQAEMYVNETDGQLRVAHLILRYTPLSLAFQAPKYVIKARDPRLHHISVAYQGSLFQRVSQFLKVLPVLNHFLWPLLQ